MCGMGRTGKTWALLVWDLKFDLITNLQARLAVGGHLST